MQQSLRTAGLILLVTSLITFVACGSGHHEQQSNNLTSLTITGMSATSMLRGTTVQLTATGKYSNGNAFDVTNSVAWKSADTSVATVSGSGLVTAVSRGTAEITATYSNVQGKGSVTVRGLVGGNITPDGAVITVELAGNPSNGMKVVADKNSTAGGLTVHLEIDDQDALPGPLPTDVVQASKVYMLMKDSTYNFAKPLEITIPVHHDSLTGNEFPVVFYWSAADNKYRATPITKIDRTNDMVTFKAAHTGTFVALSIPNLATTLATSAFDTKFVPSVDGFFHPNTGSYESAGGACMGMAMFSEWFFGSKKKTVTDPGLGSKFLEGDVAKWQDDVTADELIDRLFASTTNIWSLYSNAKTGDEGLSAQENAIALMMSLVITNEPQTMLMRFSNGQAHAITVYGWAIDSETGTPIFGVYDSNFPADDGIRLAFDGTKFALYTKAAAYPQIDSFTFLPMGVAVDGSEFDAILKGADDAFAAGKFDQIAITAPVVDAKGNYIVDPSQALTVTGTVTPAGALPSTQVAYSWNGTPLGTAKITGGAFSFTIPKEKLVGYANSLTIVSTSDPKDVFKINGRREITTKILGAIFFDNPGFETGDFTGWTTETHLWPNGCCGVPPLKSAIVDSTVLATDPNSKASATDIGLSTVYSGRYAARVNNEDDSYHISSVSQTVTVPEGTSPQIRFYWAAVLENPGHPRLQQPYADITVTDNTASTTLYSQRFYSADTTYNGWVQGYYDWLVIPWQTVVIDVSGAVGHQITIKVAGADCAQGGHGGYVYFDADEQ